MAQAQLIDLSNYDTLLVQSTQGREGTPDGNFYFDRATGGLQLITKQELPQVDLGSGLEDNPLDNKFGIKFEAAYAFENQERRIDESLRQYNRWTAGTFKFGGAYELINNRKFDDQDGTGTSTTGDDRKKVRGSGWNERDVSGAIGRIFFGTRSLGFIDVASQPFFQTVLGGAPTDFSKLGDIDESIQVYGDNSIDPNTTTFDSRTYLSNKVRTFGFNYDEKILADSGINQMDGYAAGFALGESPHLTTGNYNLSDVYGGSQIAPWTTMSLEKLSTPFVEGGFTESDGSFTWFLNNTVGGLYEVVAFFDALSQTDDVIDAGGLTTTRGKRVGTWYSYDAQGRIVTNSPVDGEGLFIQNIPVSDEQLVVFVDDNGDTKTRPFQVDVRIDVGQPAVSDVLAWFHNFFAANYGTPSAVTVQDSSSNEVKGDVSSSAIGTSISYPFDYDGDTVGGPSGTDKNAIALVEGDGGATQAKTLYTLIRQTTISLSCSPLVENNV